MKLTKEVANNILVFSVITTLHFFYDAFIGGAKFITPVFLFVISHYIVQAFVYIVNYKYIAVLILKKNYKYYLLSFIGLIVLYASLRFIIQEIIIFKITGFHNYSFDTMTREQIAISLSFDSFYYTFRVCLYSSAIYLLHRFNESKEQLNLLNLSNQKAQLSALKSQINPHFLFNTLNNFYVELIDDKPKTAEDILKLSNLMRFVTYETNNDFIELEKEINFIKDYIHFYKRRYEDNLNILFSINGEVKNQLVPSLTLLHFVENVCKHGIINDKKRSAEIEIRILEKHLEISTTNYLNTSEKHSEKGIGTENITKRLEVLFDKKFILKNTKNNTIFKSYLKIPLK